MRADFNEVLSSTLYVENLEHHVLQQHLAATLHILISNVTSVVRDNEVVVL